VPETAIRYPALFAAADEASQSAQTWFSWLAGLQLVAPVAAAILGLAGPGWPRLAAAAMFSVGLATSIAMQIRRPERAWFDGRALAESIKTMAWRYVMGVAPYEGEDLAAADEHFHTRFKALIVEYQQLGGALARGAGPDITDEMRTLRQRSLPERKEIYAKQRLGDQVSWYRAQAKSDESRATVWLWLITLLQLGGLVLASVQLARPTTEANLLPLLAAVIAAAFAWLQLKRHQELAKAYGVAALELGTLLGRINECDTPERLAAFVEEAEEAMSREHTLWRARRT